MSHPHSSDPLPPVILVPPRERKPTARRKASSPFGEINWMKIAIGGSIAWMGITLVVGLYFSLQGDRQPIDEGGLPPVPAVKPVGQELAAIKPLAAPQPVDPMERVEALPENKGEFVDCQQIGVNVLFMKEPADAFQRARAEKKAVFIVHLSGNLEDKEFT